MLIGISLAVTGLSCDWLLKIGGGGKVYNVHLSCAMLLSPSGLHSFLLFASGIHGAGLVGSTEEAEPQFHTQVETLVCGIYLPCSVDRCEKTSPMIRKITKRNLIISHVLMLFISLVRFMLIIPLFCKHSYCISGYRKVQVVFKKLFAAKNNAVLFVVIMWKGSAGIIQWEWICDSLPKLLNKSLSSTIQGKKSELTEF